MMNFQKMPSIETSSDFLDKAFRKARERGKQKKLTGNWLQTIRKKEGLKIDIVKDSIVSKLEKIHQTLPDLKVLPEFYIKLMKLTLDFQEFKRNMGSLPWAIKQISKLHRESIKEIHQIKEGGNVKNVTKHFYGRLSSVLKQIDPQLKSLEKMRKVMCTYPDIKEMFTICIYGFPNVGKSTLLNKLTGTTAEIAAYSFTTKSINAGYLTSGKIKVQVLDVPGTLARKDKMNNIELQAELVVDELADMIIFVFDFSGNISYSVEEQEKLFKNLKSREDVLVYISKQDITNQDVVAKFKHKHYSLDEIKTEIEKVAKDIE